jgi:hypothetical protein
MLGTDISEDSLKCTGDFRPESGSSSVIQLQQQPDPKHIFKIF